jgi:hypothetical protein
MSLARFKLLDVIQSELAVFLMFLFYCFLTEIRAGSNPAGF